MENALGIAFERHRLVHGESLRLYCVSSRLRYGENSGGLRTIVQELWRIGVYNSRSWENHVVAKRSGPVGFPLFSCRRSNDCWARPCRDRNR